MKPTVLHALTLVAVMAGAVPASCGAAQTAAGGAAQAPRTVQRAQADRAAPVAVIEDADASEIRREFIEVLRRYPPAVGHVLKLDPSLLGSDAYLQSYPALAAFLAEHPNVRHNPGYFLEHVDLPSDTTPRDPRGQAVAVWREMFDAISVFTVLVTLTLAFLWCLKAVIDHRRWSRLQKVQTEVHNKLLDRFAATDDLLRYMQTPAGRRFLESTPIALDGPRSISAPLGRILWSIQAGLVLGTAGLGLQFVSGRLPEEVAPPLFAIGMLALSLGVGFILAAGVSFALSRRLGLFDVPAAVVPTADGSGHSS